MRTIQTFEWRKLSALSLVEHRVNEAGQIAIRNVDAPGSAPFPVSRAYEWIGSDVEPTDNWILRTAGAPVTMRKLVAAFGELAASAPVDERVILTTIACESGPDSKHPSGRSLTSPRTEIGYPDRTGESDLGDEARDAVDWAMHLGMHSSHGIMQTLIGTAYSAAPDLFVGKDPSRFREVLWDPANSVRAGGSYIRQFPAEHLLDPVKLRFHYGTGGVYPSPRNRWGARMYELNGVPAEGPFILNWIAFWNDLVGV